MARMDQKSPLKTKGNFDAMHARLLAKSLPTKQNVDAPKTPITLRSILPRLF